MLFLLVGFREPAAWTAVLIDIHLVVQRLRGTHPYQADLILAWNKIHALATPP